MENKVKHKTKFVTFYSFKGGVGRTSALINSAIVRARSGSKVVVVDFDFEAPGLNLYCNKIDGSCGAKSEGIVEYFSDKSPSLIGRSLSLTKNISSKNGGDLWLIPAGNIHSKKYTEAIDSLKWSHIFEHMNGELVLENFKNQIVREFDEPDYVFIDSRTGITEIGGVCTRYLADIVVMLTSLNNQNIQGTAAIYNDLDDGNKKFILVASNVPVGMPHGSDQRLNQRVECFAENFKSDPDLFIYHFPALSLEEYLPVLSRSKEDHTDEVIRKNDPLFSSYKQLAKRIDSLVPNSFGNLLERACQRNFIMAANESSESLQKYDALYKLQNSYPERLLTKLLLKMVNWLHSTFDRVPEEWDHREYEEISASLSAVGRSPLVQASVIFNVETMSRVRAALSSKNITMVKEYERYFEFMEDYNVLDDCALGEIEKKKFKWATDYYSRRIINLEKLGKPEVNEELCVCLFNLARCLDFQGESVQARLKYERLLNFVSEIFPNQKKITANQLNRALCLVVIYSRTGQVAAAHKSIEDFKGLLAEYKGNPDLIFSPFSYANKNSDEILGELKKFSENNL